MVSYSVLIFRKSRPVPFAAAGVIENELKRLQILCVICPVKNSGYDAPMVAMKEKGRRVRICANCSSGLCEPEKYSLLKPDKIFPQLSPFKLFSMNDRTDAFLQVAHDDDSKKLMKINTHCGLFQVNRLQPGIFQKWASSTKTTPTRTCSKF